MGKGRPSRKLARKFMLAVRALHPWFTRGQTTRKDTPKGTPMLLSALLLPILAAAAPAAAPPAVPQQAIVVTGRGGVPFISPMGEPIRARKPNEDTLARWFGQVDRNHDGFLTADELQADAAALLRRHSRHQP